MTTKATKATAKAAPVDPKTEDPSVDLAGDPAPGADPGPRPAEVPLVLTYHLSDGTSVSHEVPVRTAARLAEDPTAVRRVLGDWVFVPSGEGPTVGDIVNADHIVRVSIGH